MHEELNAMAIVKPRVAKRKLVRSRSSSASSSKRAIKKKRVSFSSALEQTRLIGTANEFKKSQNDSISDEKKEETPVKGILKKSPKPLVKKKRLSSAEKATTVKIFKKQPEEETAVQEEAMEYAKEEIDEFEETVDKPIEIRRRKTLKVKRSTKEVLMTLGKKERREFIRQLEAKNKPNIEVIRAAKMLWERMRSSKTPDHEKEECIKKLLELVRGKLPSLIYSHATCRIVQCLLALNKPQIRQILFDELKPEVIKMAKSKYAKYIVSKMLSYGSLEQRNEVIQALRGHYVRLFKLAYSVDLVDSIYGEWAVADQYHSIVAEFYGPEYVLFQDQYGSAPPDIEQIALNSPEKIPLIMKNLEPLLENAIQKIPTLRLSITHKLLLDYLSHCTEDQRQSMIDSLKDHLPEICHTRDGSRAALICVWNANSRDRKAIVKAFKGLAIRSCQDEFVRRVLFGIFDTVDDTVLVNKIITQEIANNIGDLVYHKNAVWVLHYLVHPRDRRVIGKGLYDILKLGDSNQQSKKEPSMRYSELFECVKPALLDFIKANMREMISNKVSAVLILDTLEPQTQSDPFKRDIPSDALHECFRAIAEIAADEFVPHSVDGPSHIVQGGCARFVFRKLLQADPLQEESDKLADFLADLPAESLSSWTGMDCGCYTLVEMLKSGSAKARTALEEALNESSLKNSALRGSKTLLAQLTGAPQQVPDEVQKNDDDEEMGSPPTLKRATTKRGGGRRRHTRKSSHKNIGKQG